MIIFFFFCTKTYYVTVQGVQKEVYIRGEKENDYRRYWFAGGNIAL